MKYLKYFETEAGYASFKSGSDYVLPNVSYVVETKDVNYVPKKVFKLRAKYNATPDNLVAFTGASNLKSLKVDGVPIKFEPVKNESVTFDVLGENISLDMETGEATLPESYLIKSRVASWSFKVKDPNYAINENTYVCMLGMMDGMAFAEPIPLAELIGNELTTNDGVTFELVDEFLYYMNTDIQSGTQIGFTLCDMDTNSGTIVFIDTEQQINVTTGGLSTYSFDSEGLYDVEIELSDPIIKMKFIETPLISIEIGNSITSIGENTFDGCSGLTEVTIGSSVTSIGDYAFNGCSGLTSIVIPDSVTYIGGCTFFYCTGLTEVTIGSSVTSIGDYAFDSCYNLTSANIPDSVTTIGEQAFCRCYKLTGELVIPDSVTYIGGGAFSGCSSLTSINIPDSVTSIGDGTFNGCSGLTGELVIPDGVTSIGNEAFQGCVGLTSIVIPDGVTSIGERAFSGCSSINEIICKGNIAPHVQKITFGYQYGYIKEYGILKVPKGSDYSSWMSTDEYYLGYYNWTIEYI